ncbi:SDR family oxidoreductase [Bradyrhizobium sp. SZCCHNRI20481]|uniref:SDR family oxidoreductase n=1 Tax=Bradyrhizobium sp. SZCCHNRI20481 TaxID=3057286 RepID=UPI002916A5F2|nr:SDR family oxidoreductase [Bradyrhizobium sp. SZCCHNRI20481]
MSLTGKVALVTGASSGIGHATARAFAEAGAKLVLTGQRPERLADLSARIPDSIYLPGNLADAGLPAELLRAALRKFGRLDIVFNNAGLNHDGTIEEIDIDAVCAMVRINVEANFRIAYTVLKHFRRVDEGHLINCSSVMGTKVRATAGAYSGTKYAVEALSEALRLELAGTGVRVSCVQPGLVTTELHRESKIPPAIERNIERPLRAEEVAALVRLIAEQPSHINIARLLLLPQDHRI